MEDSLLDWIEVVGPLVLSWPIVVIVALLLFRQQLFKLIERFTESPESTAEIGPLKIQLGKPRMLEEVRGEVSRTGLEVIDLSQAIGEIRDTGPEGTTVGFCVAYAMQAAVRMKTGENVILSPRSIYVTAKKYDEFPGEDHEGTSIAGALKAMQEVGAYLESDWPYSNKTKPEPGTKPAYRISTYQELEGVEQVLNALRQDKVVITAITATEDFYTPDKNGRVIIKLPIKTLGVKTVCLVGYNGENAEFRFANDWGKEWGANGFGLVRDTDLSRIFLNAYTLEV